MGDKDDQDKKPTRVARPAQPTTGERLDTAGRAVARTIVNTAAPVVGEALTEYLADFFPSIRKRREDAWVDELRKTVNYLLRHSLRLEDLKKNDDFHDIVCAASEAARRTHLDEKRTALSNAITNSALPNSPNQTKQHIFIKLVDELSDAHLLLLRLLDNPSSWFTERNMALPKHRGGTGMQFDKFTSEARLEAVLKHAFPTYRADFLELLLDQVRQRGLVADQPRDPLNMFTTCSEGKSFTTVIGIEFLRFISPPPASEDCADGES